MYNTTILLKTHSLVRTRLIRSNVTIRTRVIKSTTLIKSQNINYLTNTSLTMQKESISVHLSTKPIYYFKLKIHKN